MKTMIVLAVLAVVGCGQSDPVGVVVGKYVKPGYTASESMPQTAAASAPVRVRVPPRVYVPPHRSPRHLPSRPARNGGHP